MILALIVFKYLMACGCLALGLYALIARRIPRESNLKFAQVWRHIHTICCVAFILLGCLMLSLPAHAAVTHHRVQIPPASALYRHYVDQAAVEQFGVKASPARLAAQLHQESSWNPHARSAVGAEGLAQFMPGTARWIAQQFPDQLGHFDPWDPQQAAMAAAIYDKWLVDRHHGATPCSTWAFALSAYNGGGVRLHHEQALAERAGYDGTRWFRNTAMFRDRSLPNYRQNRHYVRHILTVLEPAYIADGWEGKAVCR